MLVNREEPLAKILVGGAKCRGLALLGKQPGPEFISLCDKALDRRCTGKCCAFDRLIR
jgi:hypothetical protein